MTTDIANILGVEPSGGLDSVPKKKEELGQEEFMRLLVAQLNNQDPTKPMENAEFLTQIAQFSTVDGIQGMETSLSDLGASMVSTRAIQASSLVGRDVISASNQAAFTPGEEIEGDAFRFNYAAVGYTYDEQRDAFIPPRRWSSWQLNETTCQWESPLPHPDFASTNQYVWDEALYQEDRTQGWVLT